MSVTEEMLSDVSFDLGWSLIERFSVLVRESGSAHERAGAHFIASRLKTLGIHYEMLEPKLYLSVPRGASVEVGGAEFVGKPPSFSAPTGPKGLAAVPVHVPSVPLRAGSGLFRPKVEGEMPDVSGKIVVTEGYPMPAAVRRFERAGAAGQVYINPGIGVHWGTCTPIWGSPGESQLALKPASPVVAINRTDGDRLLKAVRKGGGKVTLRADLEEGWSTCLLVVAHIDGQEEDFVLVHGHYDSWDVGIGDNAVGNATMLEMARILGGRREELRRSLRLAWWPGHSTGRYAGSAWYADNFALDLHRRCVAAVNIDSPGCRGATAYDAVPWMAEADDVCRAAIRSVSEAEPERQRPSRAGDYSFNQLGVSSLFMSLSGVPREERKRLGYYPVGGCGGNIAWHTEKDRIDIADRANLERDLRVYLAAVGELLTAEVIPLDYRKTAAELDSALAGYEAAVGKRFSLVAVRQGLDGVIRRLNALYPRIEQGKVDNSVANELLRRLGRFLVPVGYSEGPRCEHDAAVPLEPIPRLAMLRGLEAMEEEEPERVDFVLTEARRHANELALRLNEACGMIDRLAPPAPSRTSPRSRRKKAGRK